MAVHEYETSYTGGEYLRNIDGAVAEHFWTQVESAVSLLGGQHELHARLKVDEDILELPVENIASLEPAAQPGKFFVGIKSEIHDHPARTVLVTGAAVLMCAASLHVASHIKKTKKQAGGP